MVADEEALDEAAGLDEAGEVARARRGLGVVVDGDGAADGDPATEPERADGRLEVLAADVVEVDVDALGGGLPQLPPDGPVLVVERRVEAEVVDEVATFSGEPALPMTRLAPSALAIWPTTLPTAPAAPDTKTTSPFVRLAMRVSPA